MKKKNEKNKRNIQLDGTKILWHAPKAEKLLKGERIYPISMDMSLSKYCNYRCQYCYGQFQKNDTRLLTKKILFDFLDDAKLMGVKGISLISDGESTCNKNWGLFILQAKQLGIDIASGTNGSLLHNFDMEKVIPALTFLRINISASKINRYCEIHGTSEQNYRKVIENIEKAVKIKKDTKSEVTIGLQMVLMPEYNDQIISLAKLGRELGVNYLVIKHVSDSEDKDLGVDYSKYKELEGVLKEAEAYSTDEYLVKVKWSKILSGGLRNYNTCLAPPILLQISGNGGVYPCGFLFNRQEFCAGNITEQRFKEILDSEKYWDIMKRLRDPKRFNVHKDCGSLCLQHCTNEILWKALQGKIKLKTPNGSKPQHINFI